MTLPIIRLVVTIMAIASSAAAGVISNVTFFTAPLIGHPAGPFAFELQFNDGSGTGDANNTAVLSNFNFGAGSPTGTPSVLGGVTGDLGSSITMTDSSFFNQFVQTFNPGAILRFQLTFSTKVDSGGVPDELSLSILDSSGFEIPTIGPADAFLVVDLSSNASILTFVSDLSQSPHAGGPPIFLSPQLDLPEPVPLALLPTGLFFLAVARRSANSRKGRVGRP